jgi:hypothetical protein
MKQGINVLTLSVISLLSPIVVQSQTVNPSYLSEMPPPARVIAEIKGKDAEDAGERQMGAFIVLVKMIDDMAYGLEHRSERQLTPDEQRISLVYQQAYMDVWHKGKDTYGKQYAGDYDHDRDLTVELLDRYFSPNFRTQYFRVNGFAAAWYKKVHANGGTSGASESANVNNGPANNPDVRLARSIELSLAKAKAANVDTTVFGLQLGLYDGLLAAVKVETRGINEDPQWSKELREKYGPPALVKPFTYTPRIGNTLKANDLGMAAAGPSRRIQRGSKKSELG